MSDLIAIGYDDTTTALQAMDEIGRQQAARAAAMSGYWLAELTVD